MLGEELTAEREPSNSEDPFARDWAISTMVLTIRDITISRNRIIIIRGP